MNSNSLAPSGHGSNHGGDFAPFGHDGQCLDQTVVCSILRERGVDRERYGVKETSRPLHANCASGFYYG